MKRAIIEVEDKNQSTRIKNRLAARRSLEKKKQEFERLKDENNFLRLRNEILEERIKRLERHIYENHSSPTTIAYIQNTQPLVDLHGYRI